MPMANVIVCSGDCYWLLVCSGVLVCSGISTNRNQGISIVYLQVSIWSGQAFAMLSGLLSQLELLLDRLKSY